MLMEQLAFSQLNIMEPKLGSLPGKIQAHHIRYSQTANCIEYAYHLHFAAV